MTTLNLDLNELKLAITLIESQDLDWLSCDLLITVSNFQGIVRWYALRSELDHLALSLLNMYSNFPNVKHLAFEGVESNVKLIFELALSGQIHGHYVFSSDSAQNPQLSGTFNIDQSYLPELANGIRALLLANKGL